MIDMETLSIQDSSISKAWCGSFSSVLAARASASKPQLISICGFPGERPTEDKAIENAIDRTLSTNGIGLSCRNVAFTIFPKSLCLANDLEGTFKRWHQAYPRLIERARKKNSQWSRGFYFYRMISFGSEAGEGINQLMHIINIWNEGVHNPMGLQVSCFDPCSDHNRSRQRSFPCLHQIGISADRTKEGYALTLHAFYPIQNITARAYGNYQGLCQLGYFLAHHMKGCKFHRLNCFIGKPTWKYGDIKAKNQLIELRELAMAHLKEE